MHLKDANKISATRLGYLVAVLAVVFALVAGYLVSTPNRWLRELGGDEVPFREALLQAGAEAPRIVELPFRWRPQDQDDAITLTIRFNGAELTEGRKSVFIPAMRRDAKITLNGKLVRPQGVERWVSADLGYYFLAPLRENYLTEGMNELVIHQTGAGGHRFAGYVAPVYIAPNDGLALEIWFSDFATLQWREISLATLMVLVVLLSIVLVQRPRDPIARWLSGIMVGGMAHNLMRRPEVQAVFECAEAISVTAQLVSTLSLAGLAAVMSAHPVPMWLKLGLALTPLLTLQVYLMPEGNTSSGVIMVGIASLLATWYGSVLLLKSLCRQVVWINALVLATLFLIAFAGIHDFLMAFGQLSGPFMSLPFARMLAQLTGVAIIADWLARSLNTVDRANERLVERLDERERDLAELYRRETERAQALTLSAERQRLTQDLHDGLSGHLVSIIALAEMPNTQRDEIAKSAREALEDLRLVLHSLDVDEGDLRVALADFYDRLAPRLRRMGVRLDWSTEALPDLAPLSPSEVLGILRILQEAITNAVRHGPARHVSLRVSGAEDGATCLIVENDGVPATLSDSGKGLPGMRKRAEGMGGTVALELLPEGGARLTLSLPLEREG